VLEGAESKSVSWYPGIPIGASLMRTCGYRVQKSLPVPRSYRLELVFWKAVGTESKSVDWYPQKLKTYGYPGKILLSVYLPDIK